MVKLSIIVPVYNVEKYIVACLESVFRQGLALEDYELIVVNDGTEDHSMELVSELVSGRMNVKIIEQQNQGLSVARNVGLSVAKGDYVLFLDSDDLLVDGSLPQLLALTEGNPDLVIGDWVKMNNEEIARMKPPSGSPASPLKFPSPFGEGVGVRPGGEVERGLELFVDDFSPQHCYVWRTLYRKAFLDDNNLRFIPGIYFEDVPFTTACYLKAGHCVRYGLPFYIYRQRADSIVCTVDKRKIMDFNKVIACLWEMRDGGLSPAVDAKLMETIYVTFCIEVWFITHNDDLMSCRHDITSDLRRRVPDIYFTGGIKQRLVSFLFRHMPDSYLWVKARL